jgi:hypothetical protein
MKRSCDIPTDTQKAKLIFQLVPDDDRKCGRLLRWASTMEGHCTLTSEKFLTACEAWLANSDPEITLADLAVARQQLAEAQAAIERLTKERDDAVAALKTAGNSYRWQLDRTLELSARISNARDALAGN